MEGFSLENIKIPEPVFSAAISYESSKDKNPLKNALE